MCTSLYAVVLALALLPGSYAASGGDGGGSAPANKGFSDECKARIVSQIEAYFKRLRYFVSEFHQSVGGVVYSGKIWISKDGTTKIKIVYTSVINQEILVIDDSIKIVDHSSGREYTHSMSNVPLYAILTGKQKLSPDMITLVGDSESEIIVRITTCSGEPLNLIFAKYELTGNVKWPLGWVIGEGVKQIEFQLNPDTMKIGDKREVPDSVFSISHGKP
jgi:hypothetical protein